MWLDSLRRLLETKRTVRSRSKTPRLRRRAPRLSLESLEDRLVLSTLTVMNVNDSGANSLRAEIAAAKKGDTIQFSSSLAGQTINLTSGDLLINKSLTITGLTTSTGAPNISISAAGASRIFDIEGGTNGVNVTLQNLNIEQGNANQGGGLYINETAGAGTVTLNNLNVTGDNATGAAGANGPNGAPGQIPAGAGGAGQSAMGGGVFFTGNQSAKLVISNSVFNRDRVNGGLGGQGGLGGNDAAGPNGTGTGNGGAGGTGGAAEGGGLYIVGGSLQLTNDFIENNTVVGGGGGKGGHGGVHSNGHNAIGGAGGTGGSGSGAGLYLNVANVQLSGDTVQFNQVEGGAGGKGGHGGSSAINFIGSTTVGPSGAGGSGGGGQGGGLYASTGNLQIATSTFKSNAATGGSNPVSNGMSSPQGGGGGGGGLFVANGTLIVTSSTLSGNAANGGGAIYNPGSAFGGGAAVSGEAYFINDTIVANNVNPGGGFANNTLGSAYGGGLALLGGDLRLLNDTIVNNAANPGMAFNGSSGFLAFGGAVANFSGSVEMANTIISGNTASNFFNTSQALYGVFNSSSHDIIDNPADALGAFTAGPGDLIGVTPNLAALGNYGGPTQTMPLLPGSPGIDAGVNWTLSGPATLAGLADWWRGEGNAADSAGTNGGTLNGGVSYVPGVSGQAFNFDGNAGSYVDFGTGPDIVGTGAFTVAAWIRTTGTNGTIIQQRDVNNFNGEYQLSVDLHGKINWYTYGNSQYGFNITSNQAVNDGNWHLIVATRQANGTGQIYIDGKLDNSASGTAVPLLNGLHVYIGEDVRNASFGGPSAAAAFAGQIDEVQIYHQALTSTQIQSLVNPASYTPIGFGTNGAWPTTLNGLVSWLPADGNFADDAGTNAGTPIGGMTFTQGKVGQAFQFNGINQQVNIADNPSLNTPSFTVGGWFQLTQAPASGSQYYLASKYDGNYHGWILSVNSSLVPTLSLLASSSSNINVTSTTKLALNQWYYISATFDNNSDTATLSINGKAVGSGSLPGGYTPSATPLVIGAASWFNGGYFAGKADEFTYYNRALSPSEINLLITPVTPTDQRGAARQVGTNVDIGATEYQYDLAATGSATASASPGGTITYNITVTNKGLDPVTNVTFSDTLPKGVTFVALNAPSGWAIGKSLGQTVSAGSGAGLAPGASATFTITATVNNNTAVGTVLTDKVSVTPTTYDTNTGNNNLSLKTTVVAPAGVDIHGQPHDALVGQSIGKVRVAVVDASGKTIHGSKPTPVTLSIYSGPQGGVLEGTTTVWSVDGVAVFTDLSLSEAGTYVLTATSGKLAPDYSFASVISPANVSKDVTVQKGSLHQKPGSSNVWEQTVTITNSSGEKLHGPMALVLTNLPSGVTLLNAGGSEDGKPYVDVLGPKFSLAPGHNVTITLSFQVTGLTDPDDLSYATKAMLGI